MRFPILFACDRRLVRLQYGSHEDRAEGITLNTSLPFTIPLLLVVAKAVGLLRLEGRSLLLEYELTDRTLGLLRSELKTVRLPLIEVDELTLKPGWRFDVLQIRVSTLRVARNIPGHDCGIIQLRTHKRDRQLAQRLLQTVSTLQSAKATERLENTPSVC